MRPLACWDCRFESRWRHGRLSLVSVLYCQVQVSASGRSLVERFPTECGVSECDREAWTRPWPTLSWCKNFSESWQKPTKSYSRTENLQDEIRNRWHFKKERRTPNTTPRRPGMLRNVMFVARRVSTGFYIVITSHVYCATMEIEKRISVPVVKPSVFILGHAIFYCVLPRNTKTKLKRAQSFHAVGRTDRHNEENSLFLQFYERA